MEIAAVAIWLAIMLALILSGREPGRRDRRERRHAAPERAALARGRAPPAPAVPAAGGLRARPPDRPDRRLAARGRAVQPRELRLPARDPRRDPLAHAGGPLRGPAARAQPALRAERRARRAHGAHGVALRGHGRRAPAPRARAARQPLHARAVRARLRDADGAGRAAAARLAGRPLRGGGHGADAARVLLGPLRRARGHARLPRGRRPGARGGAHHVLRGRAQHRAVARAHSRARARGPGARHRGGLPLRVPVPAAPRPLDRRGVPGRARAPRVAARLLARRGAGRRPRGAAPGRGAGGAGRGHRRRRGGRAWASGSRTTPSSSIPASARSSAASCRGARVPGRAGTPVRNHTRALPGADRRAAWPRWPPPAATSSGPSSRRSSASSPPTSGCATRSAWATARTRSRSPSARWAWHPATR